MAPSSTASPEPARLPDTCIYGDGGQFIAKVAVTDSDAWLRMDHARNPWRGTDSHVDRPCRYGTRTTKSGELMHLHRRVKRLHPGEALFRQGETGTRVALILDGVVDVVRDGVHLAEIGPGAIVGERALLEGARTSTVLAATEVIVALVEGSELSRRDLELLVEGHRREDDLTNPPSNQL